MNPPLARDGRSRAISWLLVVLGTAVAYAAVGWAALMLAGPPAYASPLYPSAGIALAASVVYGRAAWPGVFIGAAAVNAGLGTLRGVTGGAALLLPLAIGLGALLQAAAGAALLRRFVGRPFTLQRPGEILRAGAFGGAVACTVSPTVAMAALFAVGAVPAAALAGGWATWWLGDTLGVLIAAPIVLTLFGRPASEWRPRRLSVGLPLLAGLGLLAAGSWQTARLAQEREQLAIERRAERLAGTAEARLRTPLHALRALHGAVLARGDVDDATLALASDWWLRQGEALRALGHGERVPLDALEAFERAARDSGLANYRVFQRDDGRAMATDGAVVALRRIVPPADNRAALGVNVLSIEGARDAVLAARDGAEPASSRPFVLTQGDGREIGLVLYQALYRGADGRPTAPAPDGIEARRAAFAGVLFVTIHPGRLLAGIDAEAAPGGLPLRWCLVDAAAATAANAAVAGATDSAPEVLAGSERCGPPARSGVAQAGELHATRALAFGGRPLELHVIGRTEPQGLDDRWLPALPGLAAAALLGALLLTVTGHSRRTELEVQERTRALRRENAERQHAEDALRQSEERLRTILDHAPVGVAFLDPHGVLLEANQRLYELLGAAPGALVGRTVDSVTHEDDRAEGLRLHREMLAGRLAVVRRQMRLRRADGTLLQARVAAAALRDDGGRVRRMVSVIEDIGEHLRLEQAEQAAAKAEAASRAKSEFVSRMSHELRTPLNAMLGFAQLLTLDRDPPLTPRQRGRADEIQRAGWHLLELINETLDLARIESGDLKLELQAVELPPLVAACRALVANAASQRGVRIVDELPAAASAGGSAALPAAWADPTRLKQVLTNLLSNAVKYNRDGGEVLVRARLEAGRLRLAVSDTGLGMSESQLQSLFQPYNRLGREASGIEGTGIGLVISRRLAELMGGTLEVHSQRGAGSTFELVLPVALTPPEPSTGETTSPGVRYQRRRVLYVEDNETNVEIMRAMLAQRPQVVLEVATLGLDGLEAARRLRPDLILLDMHLPDISGQELLRHLKQDDDAAAIPVVVVSADATPARIQQALTLGAARYVTKPIDLAALLDVVDETLEAAETRWGY
jgi:PAS domain S-box-containing protein